MNSILFVGGVHGAGKSTISALLAQRLPAFHVTAGQLIRETARADYFVTIAPGSKTVANVEANQQLLLRGLEFYKTRIGPGIILLDGHFSLLSADGDVSMIPVSVFRAIAPIGVLLVETESVEIHRRLLNRDADQVPSLAVLALLANRERVQAQAVSTDLGIPMEVVRGDGPPDSADALIHRLQRLRRGPL
jgi:adenylate kinase